MILQLFMFLFLLSFLLIIIGLWKPEHTELSLIGFLFIFLLSFNILSSTLEIKNGETINTTYTYDAGNDTLLFDSAIETYTYDNYGNHQIGFWLLVGSVLGFVMLLYSLKKTNWGKGPDD